MSMTSEGSEAGQPIGMEPGDQLAARVVLFGLGGTRQTHSFEWEALVAECVVKLDAKRRSRFTVRYRSELIQFDVRHSGLLRE